MTTWVHLFRKELRLGLPAFLMPVIALFVICTVGAFAGQRFNDMMWEPIVGIIIVAIGLQTIYLAYFMLYSLSTEKNKLHLWLHNPLPSYGLLSAKLAAGFISMLVTLTLTLLIGFIAVTNLPTWQEMFAFVNTIQLLELGFYGGVAYFSIAISLAIWLTFFWMVFLKFSTMTNGFVSFIATVFIAILFISITGWFSTTGLYEFLTQWGYIEFGNMLQSISITTNLESGTDIMTEQGILSFYLGSIFYEALFIILLFTASCWLLDRKIEV